MFFEFRYAPVSSRPKLQCIVCFVYITLIHIIIIINRFVVKTKYFLIDIKKNSQDCHLRLASCIELQTQELQTNHSQSIFSLFVLVSRSLIGRRAQCMLQ